jgi:magnesium-protoporphyrin O-methyltransferase
MGGGPECCGADYDALFDERMARGDLDTYRRKGPQGTTRRLIEALKEEGVAGRSLLDIGGGVGIVQLELLAAGVSQAVDVDASAAYVAAARAEAVRRGYAERTTHRYGDFVRLADEIEPADIVTLDRVICCYGDVRALVARSAERARRLYGLVYPVDRWWVRLVGAFLNNVMRLFGRRMPFHVHATSEVDRLVREHGLEPLSRWRGLFWQLAIYRRAG